MTAALDDPAVVAYLSTLGRLLDGAPDRELVLDGVRQHIDDALGGGRVDEARVRVVLDELGDPAVIAAEAVPGAVQPEAPFLERRSGAVTTVLLLVLGGFVVPVVGWIVGIVLLWTSRGWTVLDKVIGTVGPAVLAIVLLAASLLLPSAVRFPHLALVAGIAIGLVVTGVHLLRRFRPGP